MSDSAHYFVDIPGTFGRKVISTPKLTTFDVDYVLAMGKQM
jgi:hypothetical protein